MADTATSQAPGFLTEINAPVPYDDDLIDLLQPIVAGVIGTVPPSLVRPRWQPEDTPNRPAYDVDWVALGVANTRHDAFPFEGHVDELEGHDSVEDTEEIDVLVSCYGPRAAGNANRLRAGIVAAQNRAYLNALGADLIIVGNPVKLPSLLTGVWAIRVDITVTLRRYVKRAYEIKTIVGADLDVRADSGGLGLDNEQYITPIIVNPPT